MKTNFNSFESVKKSMKATKAERDMWKATYYSLNKLLSDAQSKSGLKITQSIFAQFGINSHINADTLKADFFRLWYTDNKGNKYPAYSTRRAKVDKLGNKLTDKDGNQLYEYAITPVRDNAWTLDKLVKCLSSFPEK